MKKLFVSLSGKKKKVVEKLSDYDQAVLDAKIKFVEDLREVGLQVSIVRGEISFNVKNFLHGDIVELMAAKDYQYPNMGLAVFPTRQFSENGKDLEYYLQTTMYDHNITFGLNITSGEIYIEDVVEPKPEEEND